MKLLLLLVCSISAQAATRTFTVTAYCPCRKCCHTYSGGPTASGAWPRTGVTVAAPRWMNFGTRLNIPGVGTRIVQDRLAYAYDSRIDVYMPTHREAKRFGIRRLRVSYR